MGMLCGTRRYIVQSTLYQQWSFYHLTIQFLTSAFAQSCCCICAFLLRTEDEGRNRPLRMIIRCVLSTSSCQVSSLTCASRRAVVAKFCEKALFAKFVWECVIPWSKPHGRCVSARLHVPLRTGWGPRSAYTRRNEFERCLTDVLTAAAFSRASTLKIFTNAGSLRHRILRGGIEEERKRRCGFPPSISHTSLMGSRTLSKATCYSK
jgi:hypothetical protein